MPVSQKVQESFSNDTRWTADVHSINFLIFHKMWLHTQLPFGNGVCSTLTSEHIQFETPTAWPGKITPETILTISSTNKQVKLPRNFPWHKFTSRVLILKYAACGTSWSSVTWNTNSSFNSKLICFPKDPPGNILHFQQKLFPHKNQQKWHLQKHQLKCHPGKNQQKQHPPKPPPDQMTVTLIWLLMLSPLSVGKYCSSKAGKGFHF